MPEPAPAAPPAAGPEVAAPAAAPPTPPGPAGRSRRRLTVLAAAVVAAGLALPALGATRAAWAPMEEGKLLTGADLVLDGAVPHRDFEHLYGPGDVWAVAVAFVVAGPSLLAERAVGLLATAVLVAAVFALATRWGRAPAAGAALMAGALILPFGVHAYSWVSGLALATAGLAAGVASLRRGSSALPVAAGILSGVALVFRADLAPAVALGALALAPAASPGRRRRWLAGAAAGVSPYLLHVAVAGPGPVVRGMVLDPLLRLRPGRSLPVPPPGDRFASWFDAVAPEPAPVAGWINPDRVVQLQAFFWTTAAAVVVLLVAGGLAWRRQRDPSVLAMAVLAAAITPQMLQRADSVHIRFVAVVAVALAPWALAEAVAPALRGRAALAARLGAGAAVALLLAAVAPHIVVRGIADEARRGRHDTVSVAHHGGRSFRVFTEEQRADVEATLAAVDAASRPGDAVFVGPLDLRRAPYSDAFLYWLLPDLEPASYFLESNPGLANRRGSGLADDVAAADVLVLSDRYDGWTEPNDSMVDGPDEPNQVVARRFRPIARHGPYRVYSRR